MRTNPELLLTKAIARRLGLAPKVVLEWARRGRLDPPELIALSARTYAMRRECAEAWIERLVAQR